ISRRRPGRRSRSMVASRRRSRDEARTGAAPRLHGLRRDHHPSGHAGVPDQPLRGRARAVPRDRAAAPRGTAHAPRGDTPRPREPHRAVRRGGGGGPRRGPRRPGLPRLRPLVRRAPHPAHDRERGVRRVRGLRGGPGAPRRPPCRLKGAAMTRPTIALLDTDDLMHANTGEPNFNESAYYNFYDPASRLGGFVRLGNRPNEGYAEMTV